MSELDLDAIQQRADAATQGPWVAAHERNDEGDWYDAAITFKDDRWPDKPQELGFAQYQAEDAEFIAHARIDIPTLIAEVRSLRDELNGERILVGDDWQAVRDQLDALPEGTQIRWRTGVDEHPALAIKRRIFGEHRWGTTAHNRPVNSTNIARDNTPIEVIA